jgi:MSHA pilin protein MshB
VRESGYTLVELVGTLVIVGCLASVALPGFFSVDQAAVRAAVAAQARAFADAVLFVRLTYAVTGRSGPADNIAGYGDGTVDTNANGYPTDTANANTIPNNATGADRCRRVFVGILNGAPPICGGSVACSASHYYRAATTAAQTCRFTYVKDPTPPRFFVYRATSGDVLVTNP